MVSIEVASQLVSVCAYVIMALVLVFGRKTEIIIEQIYVPTSPKEIKKALAKKAEPEPIKEIEPAKPVAPITEADTFKVEME